MVGREVPALLGVTVEGERVTLLRVESHALHYSIEGGHTAAGRAHTAIIGLHASSADNVRLHWLAAQFTSMTEWLGTEAFDLLGAFARGGEIQYTTPNPQVVAKSRGKTFSVYGDVGGLEEKTRRATSVSLRQRTWVDVRARTRRPLAELQEDIFRFGAFLSFVCGRDCPATELVGEVTVPAEMFGEIKRSPYRDRVWVLFHRAVGDLEPTNPRFMLFRYPYAENVAFRPLARWFRRAPLLEPVYNLYLSAIPTQSPKLEYRFLALAQALDAYYFRRFRKEPAFVDVVRALVNELPRSVRRGVPDRFAVLVKDTRHYFTHWNPRYEQKAAKGDDLIAVMFGLMVMLELLLLRELGFSKSEIAQMAERNARVGQRIAQSFGQLSDAP